jgi:hypothetical protein
VLLNFCFENISHALNISLFEECFESLQYVSIQCKYIKIFQVFFSITFFECLQVKKEIYFTGSHRNLYLPVWSSIPLADSLIPESKAVTKKTL